MRKKKLNKVNHPKAYYAKENLEFYDEYHTYLTDKEAKIFNKKIAKHFKRDKPKLKFTNNNQSGTAICSKNLIKISHNPSAGLLAHELSHIISYQDHTKECYLLMRKIIKYSKKKNYWRKGNIQVKEVTKFICSEKCGFKTTDIELAISHFELTGHSYKKKRYWVEINNE